jgi:hypothetical protein
MGWFSDRNAKSKTSTPAASREERTDRLQAKVRELYEQLLRDDYWPEFDLLPLAHHPVFQYLEHSWANGSQDPEFERKSLSRDFGMKAFNLAALLYLVAERRGIPTERIVDTARAGSVPGLDMNIAVLVAKIDTMAKAPMDELLYLCALAAGTVLDPNQETLNRLPVLERADSVAFISRAVAALESN